MNTTPTVIVAMSGGVDSSVAAALLVEAGYRVVGVTLKLFCYGEESLELTEKSCCSLDSTQDALAVCHTLGIPHYVWDFSDRFEAFVTQNFVDEYLHGRTPIPCVRCNTYVKVSHLLPRARAVGADLIATGHYARIANGEEPARQSQNAGGPARRSYAAGGPMRLLRGRDRGKDQSYFLWGLDQTTLKGTLFPLGELTKAEVREKATALGLKTAQKPESQEICFVPEHDLTPFFRRRFRQATALPGALKPGPIVDTRGQRLGEHPGIAHFTVGQRRGLGIAMGEPRYVIRIIPETQTVVVGTEEELYAGSCEVTEVNWIGGETPGEPVRAEVKIRYRHPEVPATIYPLEEARARGEFDAPQRAVTPGQSAVFYRGEEVLGGGVIDTVTNT